MFVNCNWVDTRWQLYSTHLQTNNTQNDTINLGRVLAVPRHCELYPGICLTTEEKARKNLSQCTVYVMPKHPHITKSTHTHTHIYVPTHTHTHTHTHHKKHTHTRTLPHITKQFKTTTVQIKTNSAIETESYLSLLTRHYSSLTTPNLQPTANQERNDQCGNQHYSRELLMMGIVVPKTCRAYKKYNKIISGL